MRGAKTESIGITEAGKEAKTKKLQWAAETTVSLSLFFTTSGGLVRKSWTGHQINTMLDISQRRQLLRKQTSGVILWTDACCFIWVEYRRISRESPRGHKFSLALSFIFIFLNKREQEQLSGVVSFCFWGFLKYRGMVFLPPYTILN